MYRKQVRRRRAVLVGLIVISLVLLSSHFSESESGPLHAIQRGVATVLSPVREVGERALKPGRDLVNWFDETFDARGDNEDLRAEVAELRARVAEAEGAVGENAEFEKLLEISGTAGVAEFEPVTARVVGRSPTVWFSTVTIDQGSSDGIERNDAVINGDGLVGRIRAVTAGSAEVELITDPDNAVSAEVVPDGTMGVVTPVAGDPDDLLLEFVDDTEAIDENQDVVTAGWSDGVVSSAYPPGILIGRVTEAEVGEQEEFQRIHVTPFADLRQLDYLRVLTGGPERPGVPG
jgi:rod shape-determining protein MreC